MKKITKLTADQELLLKKRYQEWLIVGRNIEPISQDAAREVIKDFYAAIGKPEPIVMTFSSPMMCILAWGALKALLGDSKKLESQLRSQLRSQLWSQLRSQLRSQLESQLESQLWSQLWSQLRSQLWSQLGSQLRSQLESQLWSQLRSQLESQLWSQLGSQLESQLRSQLWSQLRSQLWSQLGSQLRSQLESQLWSQLGSQLRSQLESQLWSQLRSQLRSQLESQLESQVGNYFGGQHWLYGEALFDFCREIGVLYSEDESRLLDLWIKQSRALHWWFPYEGIVLLSQRHSTLHVDEEGRLHSEIGPACAYSDGWGVWAWHGITVSQNVIEDTKSITIQNIRDESNSEVRRVMVERMGWDAFCAKAKTKVIHVDELHTNFPDIPVSAIVDEGTRLVTNYRAGIEHAQLLQAEELTDFDNRPLRFVRLADPSTGREYTIRVKHDHTRCYEAVGWTFGLSETDYKRGRYIRQGDVFLKPLSGGPLEQRHS